MVSPDKYVNVEYYDGGMNPFHRFVNSESFISTDEVTYIDYKGWLYKVNVIEYGRQIPTEQAVYCFMPTYTIIAEDIARKFPCLTWQATNKTDIWYSYSILRSAIESRHSTFKNLYK